LKKDIDNIMEILRKKSQAEVSLEYYRSLLKAGDKFDHKELANVMEMINWCDKDLLKYSYEREHCLINTQNDFARKSVYGKFGSFNYL
jgi:hypothetical protein